MDLPPTSYPDHVIWQYPISCTSDSANTTLHHCCIPFNLAYVVSSLVISCMLQSSYWWLIGYLICKLISSRGRERVRKREKPTLTICVQRLEITEEEIEDLNWKCKTKQTCTCADIDLSSNWACPRHRSRRTRDLSKTVNPRGALEGISSVRYTGYYSSVQL